MRLGDVAAAVQVGDGARHLEHAGVAARGQAHHLGRAHEQLLRRRGERAVALAQGGGELRVAVDAVAAVALQLYRTGGVHARAYRGGGFLLGAHGYLRDRHGFYLYLYVYAVQQGPGYLVAVAAHVGGRAAAFVRAGAVVAARLCCAY